MNFLGHIYLSGEFNERMIGNFIADLVKGKAKYNFSPGIIKGIEFHRKIDCYTDKHPAFIRSKRRLSNKQGKFAPVVTDIFFDHFLAAGWNKYSDIPLKAFTESFYDFMRNNINVLPDDGKFLLTKMIESDWLYNYSSIPYIGKTLIGLSGRTKFNSNMDTAINDLIKDYDLYQADFDYFFKDISNCCRLGL